MKVSTGIAATALALSLSTSGVLAAPNADFGKFEYESNCASCHGLTGKGDGPLVRTLLPKPPDLTVLEKSNGGVFPAQRVYEIIDGRKEVEAHGTRTMPVWGKEYQSTAPLQGESGVFDFGPSIAHARIASVIDYLYRIQER